jgi:TPR repeat protein
MGKLERSTRLQSPRRPFFHGHCCPEDFAEGLRLWQLACDQGFVKGQAQLGIAYLRGLGMV